MRTIFSAHPDLQLYKAWPKSYPHYKNGGFIQGFMFSNALTWHQTAAKYVSVAITLGFLCGVYNQKHPDVLTGSDSV
jgi:hypothetical protein